MDINTSKSSVCTDYVLGDQSGGWPDLYRVTWDFLDTPEKSPTHKTQKVAY